MNSLKSERPADLDTANRIDLLCDEFEEQWRSGDRPLIEDFLGETLAENRSTLLVELVKVEAYYRQRAGEIPSLQEYRQRFPHDSQLLSDDSLSQEPVEVARRSPPPAKTSIGDFDLLEMVGDGAFGCVWKARDRLLGRIVAVKLPRGARWSDADAAAFLHEAKSAAQLRHPNLVQVFGVEHDGETAFIVSEFVAGSNLKDRLQRNRPTFTEAARLCAQLARALHHAHAHGIIHRDLKPANIIVDEQGEPHITDFGLAKRISAEGSTISGHHIMGTPAYMSPEQAAGDSKHVDCRSDLYSLAGVLYELLTGQRVFEGDQASVLRMVLTQDPVPPRRIRADIPRDLETICLKGLTKAREERYADAVAFAEDLERFLRNEPVPTRLPRSAGGRRWSRRKFATLALSAAAGGYALWSGLGRRERKFSSVVLHTNPSGAEVWFIPLDPRTGVPDPAKIIAAGRSPVELELPPGEYLVEAVLDERRFQEVYRRVPHPDEQYSGVLVHQHSMLRPGAPLALAGIRIPEASITDGMARLQGTRRFSASDATPSLSDSYEVPPFFMDPYELTCGEYRACNGRLPRQWSPPGATDAHALWIDLDNAISLAERMGKRLPDEIEHLFAASAGGRSSIHLASASLNGAAGPVNDDPSDRIELDPNTPIFGLRSNVAEWTMTIGEMPPGDTTKSEPRPVAPEDYRIVRGIGPEVEGLLLQKGVAVVDGRSSCWRTLKLQGLGARCVRSLKPRLTAADFVRRLPDRVEST